MLEEQPSVVGKLMSEINILMFIESRYKLNRRRIKSSVEKILKEQGIIGPAEVSIAVVGDRKMRALYKKYKGEDRTTNVLSFPLGEGESTNLPSDILRLGDIILSYPQVIKEASEDDVLVDDKIEELVMHSMNHLLGIHH